MLNTKLDIDAVIDAAQNDEENLGFCLNCGEEAYEVEPDARRYLCDCCGQRKVYGAQEILLMLVI